MSKVAAIAKLTAADGQRDALVKVMDQLVDAAADETGTEIYVLNLDVTDPNVVWFYEVYTDKDGLRAHSTSPTMQAVGSQLGGLLVGAPELIKVTPHRAVGIEV
jgi:quinol monooxygenase YgiN